MTQTHAASEIGIRQCSSVAEYEDCVRIQRAIWGESIAVPVPIFVVAHHTGGQILGAFEGGQMVGFTQAFTAQRAGRLFLHSHIAAVLPEYRDRGVGRRLKLFQRQDALKRGIDMIEWTFDPLDLKNAYFNLVRLGAVARRYIPNCYGVTDSPLHARPADRPTGRRMVARFRPREVRIRGRSLPGRGPRPSESRFPRNLPRFAQSDRAAAARIQSKARDEFQQWFAKGYISTVS